MESESLLPPYLVDITDYLAKDEPALWDWFTSEKVKSDYADEVRLSLLKSTYRIDHESQPELYSSTQKIAESFGVESVVTLYQAQQSSELNASLAYIPKEPHVIFFGPLLKTLQPEEIEAIVGHELHHFVLWEMDDQRYFIANQILSAMEQDRSADDSHYESARLFSLYTEIFCDRGALRATNNLDVTISALVKMITGLDKVSPGSYLEQATEILEKQQSGSENQSHPESFLRTKALEVWSKEKDNSTVSDLIRGTLQLDRLDLIDKTQFSNLTFKLINSILQYSWMQTESVMAHARQFFHDINAPEKTSDNRLDDQNLKTLSELIKVSAKDVRDYFCYILLDFSVVDKNLDEAPLAAGILISKKLKILPRFSEIAKKELKMTKKKFDALESSAADLISSLDGKGNAHE